MTNKTNSKGSARKKLIPAVGMLTVSAMMLSSATYAWFTMAREVEVTNIQMTASVPADLQISLGMLTNLGNAADTHGLGDNWGTLVPAEGTSADNGGVATPTDDARYWSNIADISSYYALGKIMPASSTTGQNIYFTPDSSGVGKTIKADANYYEAFSTTNGTGRDANGDSYMTTLHAYTSKDANGLVSDNWATAATPTYKKAKDWNMTYDDGYFVDIPVWIRTSSTDENVQLSVDAYVSTNSQVDNDDLYLAARAVILGAEKNTTSNLIEIKQDSYRGTDSIVDFMSSTNSTGAAVSGLGTARGDGTYPGAYGAESYYDGKTGLITVTKSSTEGKYGAPTKVWIRVWLEGEDSNCWNENAGQNFNVSLKFSRDDAVLPTTTHHYNTTATADGTTASLSAGTTTDITVDGTAKYRYTYNGIKWQLTASSSDNGATFAPTGTFEAAPAGMYYKIGTGTSEQIITNGDELAAWLKTNVTTATEAGNSHALTSVIDAANPLTVTATVTSGTATFSPDISGLSASINSLIFGGKTFTGYSTSATGVADGTYNVDIVYNANAPLYTVTYHDVAVTTGSDSSGSDTLKLMRVAESTVGASSTYTYKWYVAADNAYELPAGTKLTASGTNYDTVEKYVAAQTAATAPAVTEAANAQTGSATVNVVGDPQGRTLTLTKTTSFGVTTWAQASGDPYTLAAGEKLTLVGKDGTGAALAGLEVTSATLGSFSYTSAVTPTVTYSAAPAAP